MRLGIVLIAGLALAFSAAPAQAADRSGEEPAFLRVGAGYFDVFDDEDAGEFHLEYIFGEKLWLFTPMVGVMATTDGALYGYAGIRLDIFLGERFVLTPQFAPGLYYKGDGKDLGHVVEFRSGIELAYRFDDRSRVGVSLYHLSNASLSEDNQGTEVVTVHYSHPLRNLFGR